MDKNTRENIDYEEYCLVLPETFNDPVILNDCKNRCQVISLSGQQSADLVVYQNALTEVRDVFRQIHEILTGQGSNIHSYDIAITCPCIDSYRPFLEEEAKKYDLKLHFTTEASLIRSIPGKFFLALDRIKKEDFSFDSINNLLINPIFPFKEDYRKKSKRIIDYAIDTKLVNGPVDEWIQHIDAAGNPKIREDFYNKNNPKFSKALKDKDFFIELADRISEIINQADPEKMQHSIYSFIEKYFEENNTMQAIWNKCLNLLNSIKEFPQKIDTWAVYIDMLGETTYAEEDNGEIPVYNYPVSAGLPIPYHFVIGLCDDKTTVSFDKYPYWPSKKGKYLPEQSTTEVLNVISSKNFCRELKLSGTSKMFDGAHLLPITMLNSAKETFGDKYDEAVARQVQERLEKDCYRIEKNCYMENKAIQSTTKNQKNSFIEATTHILTKEITEFPTSDELQGKDENNLKNVNASCFKGYAKCPYWGFIDIYYRPKQKEFEPKRWDLKVIGNILHESIQNSLKTKEFRDLDKETLVSNLKCVIKTHADKYELCSEAEQKAILGKYAKLLPSIANNTPESKTDKFIPEGTDLYENEVDYTKTDRHKEGLSNYLKLEGLNLAVGGRPDTILQYKEKDSGITRYILLDYKTSGTADYDNDLEECSPQLAIYARMIEANEKKEGKTDAKVTHGAYYSVNNEEMLIVWPRIKYKAGYNTYAQGHYLAPEDDIIPQDDKYKNTQYVNETTDRLFRNFSESVNNSSFDKTEDHDKCDECYYKRICRKEFIVK